MSHLKERSEKICLNCNAELYGRYCHVCGQENLEPKETFWHLVTHFVYDVTHFDGKFFSSAKYLLFKPGYLSHEYIRGKRASYLNPIRMYVFVSAIFFLFFLAILKPENAIQVNETADKSKSAKDVIKELQGRRNAQEEVINDKDIPEVGKIGSRAVVKKIDEAIIKIQKDSTQKSKVDLDNGDFSGFTSYKTVASYDSVQNALPESKRDGWIKRTFLRRNIEVNEEYGTNGNEMMSRMGEKFFHSFPQIMFVSLPLFALVLQLLYIRRKNFYYVDHIIYSVHLYCGIFVLFFVLLVISQISKIPHLSWVMYLAIIVWLYLFYYTYKGLRNFYEQGRGKTILKWFLLNSTAFFIMMILFAIYGVIALFTF